MSSLENRRRQAGAKGSMHLRDLRKIRSHYPRWNLTRTLDDIFDEIVAAWLVRQNQ